MNNSTKNKTKNNNSNQKHIKELEKLQEVITIEAGKNPETINNEEQNQNK